MTETSTVSELSPIRQLAAEIGNQIASLRNESSSYLENQIELGEEADVRLDSKAESENADPDLPGIRQPVEQTAVVWMTPEAPSYATAQASYGSPAVRRPRPDSYQQQLEKRIQIARGMQNYQGAARLVRAKQVLSEETAMAAEDKKQLQLIREMHKVHELQRQLLQAKRKGRGGKRSGGSSNRLSIWSDKLQPLWQGVDVHVTEDDLKPKSIMQKGWEYHLWHRWDVENRRDRRRENLVQELKLAKAVRDSSRKGRYSAAEDRAIQMEIAELSNTTDHLWWEYDPTLHYRDLGPDGRPVPLRDSLVFKGRAPQIAPSSPPARPSAQHATRAAVGRRPCKCGQHCASSVFCRFKNADDYLSYVENPKVDRPQMRPLA